MLLSVSVRSTAKNAAINKLKTSSSGIAERPQHRVGQFWPKVEDDILQTL